MSIQLATQSNVWQVPCALSLRTAGSCPELHPAENGTKQAQAKLCQPPPFMIFRSVTDNSVGRAQQPNNHAPNPQLALCDGCLCGQMHIHTHNAGPHACMPSVARSP